MGDTKNLVEKLKEDSKLLTEKYATCLKLHSEQYNQLHETLNKIKEEKLEYHESITKNLNELLDRRNVLNKIINDQINENSGLPLSIENQELLVKVMPDAINALNKATSILHSLDQSSSDNTFEMRNIVSRCSGNLKKVTDDVKRSIDLIENLQNNINTFSQRHDESSDDDLEGSYLY